MKEHKVVVCKKCLGVFDEGLEFCPHCKVPSLWSTEEFQQARLEKTEAEANGGSGPREYSRVSSPAQAKGFGFWQSGKDYTKVLLVLAVLIAAATTVYYLIDKQNNLPTAQELAAIQLVQSAPAEGTNQTIQELFAELEQSTQEFVRVIGWKARPVEAEPGIFLVSFVVDEDLANSNGTQEYIFEANLNTGQVLASSPALIQKYRGLGFIA